MGKRTGLGSIICCMTDTSHVSYDEPTHQAGGLIVVPTPIGNLGDITLRAIEALRSVDAVLCEDTRVTGRLLSALDLKRPLVRLDENTIRQRSETIIERMREGERFAYCSDAGMPGVSDPGMHLIAEAREQGCEVEVLPGASAVTTAYVASGFQISRFLFAGFMPRKDEERRVVLEGFSTLDAALIFYDSPRRVAASTAAIAQVLPHRTVALCRELTKAHEEVIVEEAPALAQLIADREREAPLKGEIVLVINGPTEMESNHTHLANLESAERRARELTQAGNRSKEVARAVAQECGISRNEAYDLALAARDNLREDPVVQ